MVSNDEDSVNEIIEFFVNRLESLRNEEKGQKMSKYMRYKQEFLGVQTPQRKEIYKEFKKSIGKSFKHSFNRHDVEKIVTYFWNKNEREYYYVGLFLLDYLGSLNIEYLEFIQKLIVKGDWWDTTDSITIEFVGNILKENKLKMTDIIKEWVLDENMWIRRSAILSQLYFKENMDQELLTYCLNKTMHEKEFFIQKAIGWALREYSKINKEFVTKFITANRDNLSKLSIREGSKYI